MRKLALVAGVVVIGASAFVTYAAAGPPTKQTFDDTSTSTETGICSFPVEAQVARLLRHPRTRRIGRARLRPLASDQLTMPTQQCLGRHYQPVAAPTGAVLEQGRRAKHDRPAAARDDRPSV